MRFTFILLLSILALAALAALAASGDAALEQGAAGDVVGAADTLLSCQTYPDRCN